jgi:hypothetical protein
MPQYMLFIRGGDRSDDSPETLQRIVEEYIAWARRLQSEGKLVGGDELAPGGKVVRGTGTGQRVSDGPFTETKEAIGGYFLIQAGGEAEALAIAAQCPGLRRGGAVEVRAIVDHAG